MRVQSLFLIALLAATLAPRSDAAYSLSQTVVAPASTSGTSSDNDHFHYGTGLAVDGNFALIGYPDINGKQGAAYFWAFDGTWSLSHNVTSPNAANNGFFGQDVALDADNGLAFVGAPGESSDTGAVYVYEYSSGSGLWTYKETISRSGATAGDKCGFSVATDRDGDTGYVAVGCRGYSSSQGAMFVFESSGGSGYTEQGPFISATLTDAQVGYRVAISRNWALVGAPFDRANDHGSASAWFRNSTGHWNLAGHFDDPSSGSSSYNFGHSVDLWTDATGAGWGAVGTGSYFRSSGHLVQAFTLGADGTVGAENDLVYPGSASFARYGQSVAFGADGDRLLVGSTWDSGSFSGGTAYRGAVYQFDLNVAGTAYEHVSKLTENTYQEFGDNLAAHAGTLLVANGNTQVATNDAVHFYVDPEFAGQEPPVVIDPIKSFEVSEVLSSEDTLATVRIESELFNSSSATQDGSITITPKPSNELGGGYIRLDELPYQANTNYTRFDIVLIGAIDFDVRSGDPTVVFEYTITDSDDVPAEDSLVISLNITDVNEAPALSGIGATLTPNQPDSDTDIAIFSGVTVVDPDVAQNPFEFDLTFTVSTGQSHVPVLKSTDGGKVLANPATGVYTYSVVQESNTLDLSFIVFDDDSTHVLTAGSVSSTTLNTTVVGNGTLSSEQVTTITTTHTYNTQPAITLGASTLSVDDTAGTITPFTSTTIDDGITPTNSYNTTFVLSNPSLATWSTPPESTSASLAALVASLEAAELDILANVLPAGTSELLTVNLTVVDNGEPSMADSQTLTINVTSVNDDPTFSTPTHADGVVRALDDDVGTVDLFDDFAVADVDASATVEVAVRATMTETRHVASVTIPAFGAGAERTLEVRSGGPFASFVPLTVDGSVQATAVSPADASDVLNGTTMAVLENVISENVTIMWTIRATDDAGAETIITRNVTIAPVSADPIVATGSQTENDIRLISDQETDVTLFPNWIISDEDADSALNVAIKADYTDPSGSPVVSTVTIPAFGATAERTLDVRRPGSFDSFLDIAGGLTMTPAEATTLLQSIVFTPAADSLPGPLNVTWTVQVDDQNVDPLVQVARTLQIAPVNDAPTVEPAAAATDTLELLDTDAATKIFPDWTVEDLDGGDTVTVAIKAAISTASSTTDPIAQINVNAANYDLADGGDFDDYFTIGSGLTPSAASALIDSVTLNPLANKLTHYANITWTVRATDLSVETGTATRLVKITPVDDAPEITPSTAVDSVTSIDDDEADFVLFSAWTITDSDPEATVSVTLDASYDDAPPSSLATFTVASVQRSFDDLPVAVATSATPAAAASALQAVTVTVTPNTIAEEVAFNLTVTVDSVSVTRQFKFVPKNDEPALTGPATVTIQDDVVQDSLFPGFGIVDGDIGATVGVAIRAAVPGSFPSMATVVIPGTNGYQDRSIPLTDGSALDTAPVPVVVDASGQATSMSPAAAAAAFAAISVQITGNVLASEATIPFTITLLDDTNAASVTNVDVVIQPANDRPQITTGSQGFNDVNEIDDTAFDTVLFENWAVNDPDSPDALVKVSMLATFTSSPAPANTSVVAQITFPEFPGVADLRQIDLVTDGDFDVYVPIASKDGAEVDLTTTQATAVLSNILINPHPNAASGDIDITWNVRVRDASEQMTVSRKMTIVAVNDLPEISGDESLIEIDDSESTPTAIFSGWDASDIDSAVGLDFAIKTEFSGSMPSGPVATISLPAYTGTPQRTLNVGSTGDFATDYVSIANVDIPQEDLAALLNAITLLPVENALVEPVNVTLLVRVQDEIAPPGEDTAQRIVQLSPVNDDPTISLDAPEDDDMATINDDASAFNVFSGWNVDDVDAEPGLTMSIRATSATTDNAFATFALADGRSFTLGGAEPDLATFTSLLEQGETSISATDATALLNGATLTPIANALATAVDVTFTVQVTDRDSAGVQLARVVRVAPVQDQPELEETGAVNVTVDTVVSTETILQASDLLSTATDADYGTTIGIAVQVIPGSADNWAYSTACDATFLTFPAAVSTADNDVLLQPSSSCFRFTASGYASGTAGLRVRAWDQSEARPAGQYALADVSAVVSAPVDSHVTFEPVPQPLQAFLGVPATLGPRWNDSALVSWIDASSSAAVTVALPIDAAIPRPLYHSAKVYIDTPKGVVDLVPGSAAQAILDSGDVTSSTVVHPTDDANTRRYMLTVDIPDAARLEAVLADLQLQVADSASSALSAVYPIKVTLEVTNLQSETTTRVSDVSLQMSNLMLDVLADTSLSSQAQTVNSGASSVVMQAGSGSDSFIVFSIPALEDGFLLSPVSASSATLRVWTRMSTKNAVHSVTAVQLPSGNSDAQQTTWVETTMTWLERPTAAQVPATVNNAELRWGLPTTSGVTSVYGPVSGNNDNSAALNEFTASGEYYPIDVDVSAQVLPLLDPEVGISQVALRLYQTSGDTTGPFVYGSSEADLVTPQLLLKVQQVDPDDGDEDGSGGNNGGTTDSPTSASGAIFESDGTSIDVSFSAPTNTPSPCDISALLSPATVTLLGSSASCGWASSTTLTIELGSNAIIVPGDSLELKAANTPLTSAGGEYAFTGATLSVKRPLFALAPVVSVPSVGKVGCQGLSVTATVSGLAGRAATYEWVVTDVESHVAVDNPYVLPGWLSVTNDALELVNAPVVSITGDNLLRQSTFTLQLTVTNFLGEAGTVEFDVTTGTLDEVIPELSLTQPSAAFPRSQTITLEGRLSVRAKCENVQVDNSTSRFNFMWEHVTSGTPITLDAASRETIRLVIPPRTLNVGQIYTFSLTATPDKATYNADEQVSALVFVTVTRSKLSARIAGGDRVTSWGSSTVLDASPSSDPDSPTWGTSFSGYTGSAYTFTWSCRRLSGILALPCSDVSSELAALLEVPTNSPKLTLPAVSLSAGKEYSFTVRVADDATARDSTASVKLLISEASVPDVSLSIASTARAASEEENEASLGSLFVVNGDKAVRLAGSAAFSGDEDTSNLRFRYSWEERREDLTLDANSVKSTLNSLNLVIRERALLPSAGQAWPTYTFRLVVHVDRLEGDEVVEENVSEGFAELSVTLNRPPELGTLSVSPLEGAALETIFTVFTSGWTDAQQPLTYSFSYINTLFGVENIMTQPSEAPKKEVLLPSGNYTIVAYITDNLGASTRVEFDDVIHVRQNNTVTVLPECFAFALSETLLDSAIGVGDTDQVVQLVQSLSNILNAGTVNDSASLEDNDTDESGLTPAEAACAAQASRETLLTLRQELRLQFVQLLANIAGSSGVDALRGQQIAQALQSLTGGDPDEVQGTSFNGILNLINNLFSLSAASASGSSSDSQDASLSSAAGSMIGVLANLLGTADCERYRVVATFLDNLFSISQEGTLPGEEGSYDTPVFESEVQRSYAESETQVDLASGVDVQLSSQALATDDSSFVDVLVTEFAERLWACPGIAQRDPDAIPVNVTECRATRATNGTSLSSVVSISVRGGDGNELIVNDLPIDQEVEFLVPTSEVPRDDSDDANDDGTSGRSGACAAKRRVNKLFSISRKEEVELFVDKCEWFDYNKCEWSDEGCRVVSRGHTLGDGSPAIKCACTHLTEFVVLRRRHFSSGDPCDPEQELDKDSYALFGIAYAFIAAYSLRQLVRTMMYVKPTARKSPLGVHSLVLLVAGFRTFISYMRYKEIDSLPDAVWGALVAVPTAALSWIFTFIILSWAGIAHFSLSHSTSSFEPLKKLFFAMNTIISLAVVGVFVPAFAADDGSEEQRDLIRTGTYLMAALMLLQAIGFFVYGMLLYAQLKSIQRDVKSTSDEKKGVSLALQILLVASAFVVTFVVVAGMWALSEYKADMYADNFTIFNSIYLLGDVICLCLALFLYGRVVDRAQREEDSKRSRASRSRGDTVSGNGSTRTSTATRAAGSTRRGFRARDGESRGSRRRLHSSARGSSSRSLGRQSSYDSDPGGEGQHMATLRETDDVSSGEDTATRGGHRRTESGVARSRSKEELVAAALARSSSSSKLRTESIELVQQDGGFDEQDPGLPPLPEDLHVVPSHDPPVARLSDASALPPLPTTATTPGGPQSTPGAPQQVTPGGLPPLPLNTASSSSPAHRTSQMSPGHRTSQMSPGHRTSQMSPGHRTSQMSPSHRTPDPSPYTSGRKTRESFAADSAAGVGAGAAAGAGAGAAAGAAAGGRRKKKQGWNKVTDRNTGKVYYYNRKTQEMSWSKPPGFEEEDDSDASPGSAVSTPTSQARSFAPSGAEQSGRRSSIPMPPPAAEEQQPRQQWGAAGAAHTRQSSSAGRQQWGAQPQLQPSPAQQQQRQPQLAAPVSDASRRRSSIPLPPPPAVSVQQPVQRQGSSPQLAAPAASNSSRRRSSIPLPPPPTVNEARSNLHSSSSRGSSIAPPPPTAGSRRRG